MMQKLLELSVRINVSAIIVHGKKVLLMQRSLTDDYYPGAWGIPGGYMEPHDIYLEQTARRETLEELGLQITPTDIVHNNANSDTNTLYIVMTAKLQNKSDYPKGATLSDEANDFRWAGSKDIADLEFTPYTKDLIEKVINRGETL